MKWLLILAIVFASAEMMTCHSDPGEPLFLTPYIRSGNISLAKKLSQTLPLDKCAVKGHSGFLTVNDVTNSNMFFWFLPASSAKTSPSEAPVVLFLQGGPGVSSLFSAFVETGPCAIDENLKSFPRNVTWQSDFNMLYIDNPVGTGFSFTGSDAGYVRNEKQVGRDLFEALQQFFSVFDEYAKNEFYISGESYAGKYVPALGATIHKNKAIAKMNFTGLIIGNGWTDPISMMEYDQLLQQLGLIDAVQAVHFKNVQEEAKRYIRRGDYANAHSVMNSLMDGDQLPYKAYFFNVTGLAFYFNFALTAAPAEFSYYPKYVQLNRTRRALNVGSIRFSEGLKVENILMLDQYQSAKGFLEEVLNNDYKVLIYNGQLDIIVAYSLTMNFIKTLEWKNASGYHNATRIIWRDAEGNPAGYVHQFGTFTEALVRNAGHMVPYDQPSNALDLVKRFIYNTRYDV